MRSRPVKPLTETYGSPVDERAQAVHSEYFAKAVACDREYNIYNEDAMTLVWPEARDSTKLGFILPANRAGC